MAYNKHPILLDVMLKGRFVCQLRYNKHGQLKIIDGEMQEVYDLEDLKAFVIQKRPFLKDEPFTIEFAEQIMPQNI